MAGMQFIVNPAGRGGAGLAAWNRFRAEWLGSIDPGQVRLTTRPGEARELAAGSGGARVVVSVGGDGTLGEVLSGIMTLPEPRPHLAVIPAGTGNDVATRLGIRAVGDAVAALRGGQVRTWDILRVDCLADGGPARRHAFLFANAGFSSNPYMKPWVKRRFSPKAGYTLGILAAALFYRPRHMTVRWDTGEFSGPLWMVIVANSEWAGGGSVRIAPGARTDDGRLDCALIAPSNRIRMIARMLPKVATGEYVADRTVTCMPATAVRVESERPAVIDVDGDLFGTTPATFSVCPGAVRLLTPPGGTA